MRLPCQFTGQRKTCNPKDKKLNFVLQFIVYSYNCSVYDMKSEEHHQCLIVNLQSALEDQDTGKIYSCIDLYFVAQVKNGIT